MVEVRRDLYVDGETGEKVSGYAAAERVCRELLETVRDHTSV